MATSLFTDCSSMQGSTTSSSSDMLTLTTAASSWCAMPASTRIRIVRLLRPHTRRILVTPGGIASYGFSVRGGKEFSTGFFVSSVDRNSEAEQKGLRIGDQILRVNGFRIDDAIHKEFVQLVSHQERLTLKVRSVGMLPVKDKDNDGLTWNVVKALSISSTPSECSYQPSERADRNHSRNQSDRVINVVLNVAPRTKLGLGICKGPEWKPGIFVQFTKEKSVAREAGLRPGDQILTVNSIDFSDVLFSEAVAVMKSSNKLDMTVHTGAGCDLFPGESSGYNSSASSVTGDQSPCWADVKSKRLTAVREESSSTSNWNQPLYANERKGRSKSISERPTTTTNSNSSIAATNLPIRQTAISASSTTPSSGSANANKEINKTIIKLSENGATSINNTFIGEQGQSNNTGTIRKSLTTAAAKENRDSCANLEGTLTKFNQNKSNNVLPPPPPMAMLNHLQHHHHHHHHHHTQSQHQHQLQHQHNHQHHLNYSTDSLLTSTSSNKSSLSASSNSSSFNNFSKSKSFNADDDGEIKIGGVAATMQRYQYANMQLAKMNKSSSIAGVDSSTYSNVNLNMESEKSNNTAADAGGSLSSAITEELKKRKARRQPSAFKEHNPHNAETKPLQYEAKRENHNNHNHTANTNNNNSSSSVSSNSNSNTLNANDLRNVTNTNSNTLNVVGDQHSALMNEFKQAHKRMFKNGFKETATNHHGVDTIDKKDRKEALLNTTMLDDDGTYRSKSVKINAPQQTRQKNDALDGRESKQQDNVYTNIPKPPPLQMTSNNSSNNKINNNTYKVNNSPPETNMAHRLSNGSQNSTANDTYSRPNKTATTASPSAVNGNMNDYPETNRHTLRLGTVTIGEYRQQTLRREPEKFDFITNQKRNKDSGDITPTNDDLQNELQNTLSRAKNLRKSNGSGYTEHQRNCPLHQQQQQQQRHSVQDYGSNGGVGGGGGGGGYSVEKLSKKLQKSSLNESNGAEFLAKTNNRSVNNAASCSTVGMGILKNGNGNRNGTSTSKSTEKSIKFG